MNENNVLSLTVMALLIFTSLGWYFAECENEILRQEAAIQSYSKPIHLHLE